MRSIKVFTGVIFIMGIVAYISRIFTPDKTPSAAQGSIYDFKMKALDGTEIDFSKYKGKSMLIVNTASKCGFTYQYEELEKIHDQYGDKVTVLGFPANNFLWQEPGSNQDIAEFCQINYGVTFQMFEKISVKGRDQHPLFEWLATKTGKTPSWNFCKYLVDKSGNVVTFYPSKVKPMDDEILQKIIAQ
ncbi:glutathione peroxidase [Pseudochryseolinea flava]|uniref:Glutathione peroxidase n=1 Tax=Pseudochryseolinea flava TaxID=2059302 RepID=A0A364Y3J7_9BACT|nr:glutathione peroxidase [Pseudochryseolinea flava]RAW00726.1 glutathione peroxidase [Pseudochryseolinea flava]